MKTTSAASVVAPVVSDVRVLPSTWIAEGDVRYLRDIEQFYNTEITEMPVSDIPGLLDLCI